MSAPRRTESVDSELVQLFDLSVDLFCIAGFDGYFKRVNRAFERATGYTQEELLARPFLDITHPDDVPPSRDALAELAHGNDIVGFETRLIRADGSMLWVEWNTSTRPEEGFVYGVGRDVTERRLVNAELDALRRVATLAAQNVEPRELFAVAAEEVARVVDVPLVNILRFEADGTATGYASYATAGPVFPLGKRWSLEGAQALQAMRRTSEPFRVDDWSERTGEIAEANRRSGIGSTVGIPIVVGGRLWGAMIVATMEADPLPEGTEERVAGFTELLATAIANAESKSELAASRRRIVAASDQARRQIERDLHDSTQQRLVSLGLSVRNAEASVPPDQADLRDELSRIAAGLSEAVAELQEISRGIHPAILSQGGLLPALRTLARRSAIPVELDVQSGARFPDPIEVAAYLVVSEAVANATKHAQASRIDVSLAASAGGLVLSVRDDGVGGADAARGSGLIGLADRVEALGGSIRVVSEAGRGTEITAVLPVAS